MVRYLPKTHGSTRLMAVSTAGRRNELGFSVGSDRHIM
jgi:hypothetical protein